MKKSLLFLTIPAFIFAQDLGSILDTAMTKNRIVKSKQFIEKSKIEDINAVKSQYYPQIDVGANYQNLNERSFSTPGDIYSAYGKIGVDLYDGGKKSSLIKKNRALHTSSKYDLSSYSKGLQLLIVEDFYNIKSKEAYLNALNEKKLQLNAELQRIKKFYEVGSATIDDVDKLNAAFCNNSYQIDSVKHEILSLKRLFTIKVGQKIDTLDNSNIKEPTNTKNEKSDYIKALKENAKSLTYQSKAVNADYMPKIRIEDTFSIYEYDRDDNSHPEGLDNQNKLMISLNMKIFDNGSSDKQKASILLQKRALEEQIEEKELEQNINIELSTSKIETVKAQIQSAKNSLISANSAYDTIQKKFIVGAVDNVAYLDALTTRTEAKAQYETALNNLQVAYASYYYYTNKNIREFIK